MSITGIPSELGGEPLKKNLRENKKRENEMAPVQPLVFVGVWRGSDSDSACRVQQVRKEAISGQLGMLKILTSQH